MSRKLQTHFTHFRFNYFVQKGDYLVDWYRYDLNEENITTFNDSDLSLFESYTHSNKINFGSSKNYLSAREDEVPLKTPDNLVPDEGLSFPCCLIIKPQPIIHTEEAIALHSEIVLVDYIGSDHHDYNLPFGVIGKIL